MKLVTTLYKNGTAKEMPQPLHFIADTHTQEKELLNLYPNVRYQTLLGFGGAFTQAAGTVLNAMPPKERKEILQSYYGPEGLSYTLARTHVDSCDFSTHNYSANNDENDSTLKHFDLSQDEACILPYLEQARQLSPGLKLFLAPWSPPPFMKSNGQKNGGGKLKKEFYTRWAQYLCRYIEEYQKRGQPVFCMAVQNEPAATQSWDSCLYTPEEESLFATNYLAPTLRAHGLGSTKVLVWDHNKERLVERLDEVLCSGEAIKTIGAAGFHWYSGDHFDAIRIAAEKWPGLLLIGTEACVEYSCFEKDAHWPMPACTPMTSSAG